MRKNGSVLMVLSFLVVIPVMTGCADSDQIIERTIGGLIEAESAAIEEARDREQQIADSLSQELWSLEPQEEEWPTEIPGYVPRLPGRISSVVSFPLEDGVLSYSIMYSDASGTPADDYERELVSKGWDVDMSITAGSTWVIQAFYGSDTQINVAVSDDQSAILTLILHP